MTGPRVLDDGAVIVPARLTALLRADLRREDRKESLHPDLRPVAEALDLGSTRHQTHRARIAALEDQAADLVRLQRRLAGAAANDPKSGVLAFPQTGPPSDQEVNVAVAMDRLRLTGQRVRQLAQSGRLVGRKVNGQWFFTRTAINDYMRERDSGGRPGGAAERGAA